jgi:hypothetical protein
VCVCVCVCVARARVSRKKKDFFKNHDGEPSCSDSEEVGDSEEKMDEGEGGGGRGRKGPRDTLDSGEYFSQF